MENERNNKPVPAQWLYMLNSSHIQRKLEQGPKLKAIFESGRKPAEIVEELYLTILSRFPTPDEVKNAESYGVCQRAGQAARQVRQARPSGLTLKRRDDWVDIAWRLINSTEFLLSALESSESTAMTAPTSGTLSVMAPNRIDTRI